MSNYIVMDFDEGEVGVTLGANYRYFTVPIDLTIVYMTVSPSADDAGCTVDLNDDGSEAIAAVDCSDQNVPGRWRSTHVGGANDPVFVAAGSLLSFDANAAAADTRIAVQIWALPGSVVG